MRTDIEIDTIKVFCPNASRLGFSKQFAEYGDVITYTELSISSIDGSRRFTDRTARVIGRIKIAPRIGEDSDVAGFIIGMVLNDELSALFERWIDPENVVTCQSLEHKYAKQRAVMKSFLTKFDRKEAPIIRHFVCGGWSDYEDFKNRVIEDEEGALNDKKTKRATASTSDKRTSRRV